jgi:hypothetical protein
MAEDFREIYLKANARPEYIKSCLADVIRNLMRAVAADDHIRGSFAASEELIQVFELIKRCDEHINFHSLMSAAVDEIKECLPEDRDDRRYIRAAQQGVKYLVESSATDNAARGRASQRLSNFLAMIEFSARARRGHL